MQQQERHLTRHAEIPLINRYLHHVALAALQSLKGLGGTIACVCVFVYVATLMGMQIFGGHFYSRTNYDSFVDGAITTLQIVIGEGWNDIMQEAIQVSGGIASTGLLAGLFFVAAVLLGHYLLLGIFLALAITNLHHFCPEVPLVKLGADDIENRRYSVAGKRHSMPPFRSLFAFSVTNKFRHACLEIVRHRFFEPFITVCIVLAVAVLAAEDYHDPHNPRNSYLTYADYVLTGIFTGELLLKVVVRGLVLHPGAYLRNVWNATDAVVVATSILGLAIHSKDYLVIRSVRLLRLLRSVRAVTRWNGLQQLLGAIFTAWKNIWGILLLATLCMFCLAVMGVSLFKGRFSYCTDVSIVNQTECVGNFTTTQEGFNATEVNSRSWETHYLNFDNTAFAFGTLMSILTLENAPTVYHQAMDSTSEGWGPSLNHRREAILYFILFIFALSIFFLSIIMAVSA